MMDSTTKLKTNRRPVAEAVVEKTEVVVVVEAEAVVGAAKVVTGKSVLRDKTDQIGRRDLRSTRGKRGRRSQ